MYDNVEVYQQGNENMTDIICKKINELTQNKLCIVGTTVDICQIPTNDNGNIAIIKAGLQTNTGRYEALGTATPQNIQGSEDTETLINKASVNAFATAATLATITHRSQQANINPLPINNQSQVSSRYQSYKNTNNNKKQFNHSSNKSASDKQISLIHKLCNKREISEEEAREMAGVPTNGRLSSKDAHAIIGALK